MGKVPPAHALCDSTKTPTVWVTFWKIPVLWSSKLKLCNKIQLKFRLNLEKDYLPRRSPAIRLIVIIVWLVKLHSAVRLSLRNGLPWGKWSPVWDPRQVSTRPKLYSLCTLHRQSVVPCALGGKTICSECTQQMFTFHTSSDPRTANGSAASERESSGEKVEPWKPHFWSMRLKQVKQAAYTFRWHRSPEIISSLFKLGVDCSLLLFSTDTYSY